MFDVIVVHIYPNYKCTINIDWNTSIFKCHQGWQKVVCSVFGVNSARITFFICANNIDILKNCWVFWWLEVFSLNFSFLNPDVYIDVSMLSKPKHRYIDIIEVNISMSKHRCFSAKHQCFINIDEYRSFLTRTSLIDKQVKS